MNLPADLLTVLEEWSTLSLAENTAIRTADWITLARCHATKEILQHAINAYPDIDSWLRSVTGRDLIGRLLAQEQENASLLADQRHAADRLRSEGNASRRHLRQIHDAYGARQANRWHSYS